MRLVHYQTPNLASTFNRLSSLGGELSQLFESQFTGWLPPLDVQESKDNYTIRVEVPGLKREDIEVSLENDELTITGERKTETPVEGTEVHPPGTLLREILPCAHPAHRRGCGSSQSPVQGRHPDRHPGQDRSRQTKTNRRQRITFR